MVRGQYIAATGMMLQRRMMENVTNNITNVETVGYKKDFLVSQSFEDVLLERRNDTAVVGLTRFVGPLNFGTRVEQKYTNFEQGSLEETGRNTDLAIAGEGLFALQTPEGERYSKAGVFFVNDQGYLTDPDGNLLLGNNGPIYVESDQFTVDAQGGVYVNGEMSDTIRVVTFEDYGVLRKQGDNLYFGEGAQDLEGAEIRQGFLENSNVEVAREMVDMITVFRAYESNQRMLTMIDETVGKAVNEIGRLR